jgi:hypothetical protein
VFLIWDLKNFLNRKIHSEQKNKVKVKVLSIEQEKRVGEQSCSESHFFFRKSQVKSPKSQVMTLTFT